SMKRSPRLARSLPFSVLFALSISASLAGCPSPEEHCAPSKCAEGERCVQDSCRPACDSQDDCPIGQNCAAYTLTDGSTGNYCVVLDYAKNDRTGHDEPCQSDAECDTLRGFTCRSGTCKSQAKPFDPCQSDEDCGSANGLRCIESQCRARC